MEEYQRNNLEDAKRVNGAPLKVQRWSFPAQGGAIPSGGLPLPHRQHIGDAGYDLPVSQATLIPPHGFADVPNDIAVELPPGTWGLLLPRSSTLRRKGLIGNPGVIDNGYRGLLYSALYNTTDQPVTVDRGERVMQLLLFQLLIPPVVEVDKLWTPEGGRGTRGFGSTGG